ncbi:RecT family recombinase [Endozoicomonas lisbonensis]|uniref:Phage RecT family recombinase n=1 Tax=Endozoicomonas lisbonensis TaxID=3120522 RepID=A0ABV2SQC4_9GAMM
MGSIISPCIQALRDAKQQFNEIALAQKLVTFSEEAHFARELIRASVPGDISNPRDQRNARYCLYQCTPDSIRNAIVSVAAVGLSLNPVLKQAYLVPRWNKKKRILECCLELSWQGMINLAKEAGVIEYCAAEQVYEEDIQTGSFVYQGALKPPVHQGNPFSPTRGKCVGVYCVAVLPGDKYITTVMNREELDIIASMSHSSVRDTWQGEMDKKSVIKRAFKTWPKPRNNLQVNSLHQLINHGQVKNFLRVPDVGAVSDSIVSNDSPARLAHDAASPAKTQWNNLVQNGLNDSCLTPTDLQQTSATTNVVTLRK